MSGTWAERSTYPELLQYCSVGRDKQMQRGTSEMRGVWTALDTGEERHKTLKLHVGAR